MSVKRMPSISLRAALVEPGHLADVRALPAEPVLELDLADDLGVGEALRQLDGVADVVAVAVRDRDHVDALGRLLGLRRLRVAGQERVDVDALAAVGLEPERRVTEPGECRHPLLSSRKR